MSPTLLDFSKKMNHLSVLSVNHLNYQFKSAFNSKSRYCSSALSIRQFKTPSKRNFGTIASAFHDMVKSKKFDINSKQILLIQHFEDLNSRMRVLTENSFEKGLYIFGSTGSGKTLLMDLFYSNCAVPHNEKSRHHFHSFMLDIHRRLHKIRSQSQERCQDPLQTVAQNVIEETGRLLCFDEFQVTDVADAMILKRLFEALFKAGIIVVATSNRSPQELYWGGLNRSVFLPFIPLLEKSCTVVDMSLIPDYRLLKDTNEESFIYPLTQANSYRIEAIWDALREDRTVESIVLPVQMGRTLIVEHSCKSPVRELTRDDIDVSSSIESQSSQPQLQSQSQAHILHRTIQATVCRFHFSDLCDVPLGAADYMSIALTFDIVVITNIPLFSASNKNQMRRFITLLDMLYEHKVRLICSAAARPSDLLVPDSVNMPSATELIYSDALEQQSPAHSAVNNASSPLIDPMQQASNTYQPSPSAKDVDIEGARVLAAAAAVAVVQPGVATTIALIDSPLVPTSTAAIGTDNGVNAAVQNYGGSSGRIHTVIGSGARATEWSATGLMGASLAEVDPRVREDEVFAFQRAVSRLYEMQSQEYIEQTNRRKDTRETT